MGLRGRSISDRYLDDRFNSLWLLEGGFSFLWLLDGICSFLWLLNGGLCFRWLDVGDDWFPSGESLSSWSRWWDVLMVWDMGSCGRNRVGRMMITMIMIVVDRLWDGSNERDMRHWDSLGWAWGQTMVRRWRGMRKWF